MTRTGIFRKRWIDDRLPTLSGAIAVSVCGFAVVDNLLHVLGVAPQIESGGPRPAAVWGAVGGGRDRRRSLAVPDRRPASVSAGLAG